MNLLKYILIAACAILFSSCALPTNKNTKVWGIEQIEQKALSFAREGTRLASRGRLIDAEFELRKAIYLRSNSAKLHASLASVLDGQGRTEEALDELNKVLKIAPDSTEFRLYKARLLLKFNSASKRKEGLWLLEKVYDDYAKKLFDSEEVMDPIITVTLESLSRSISQQLYLRGLEQEAFCFSDRAVSIRNSKAERESHSLLVNALNLESININQSMVQKGALSPKLAFQFALSHASQKKFIQADKLLKVVRLPVVSKEGQVLRKILDLSIKTEPTITDGTQDLLEEEKEEKEIIIEEPIIDDNMELYWPQGAIDIVVANQNKLSSPLKSESSSSST